MLLKTVKDMTPSLKVISNHIDKCLNQNDDINLGLIGNQLRNICSDNTSFTVKKVVSKPNKPTFIMCVYPDADELEKLANPLAKALNGDKFETFIELWSGIKKWHIEFDSRLVTKGNPICVDNGDQFVAILSHELGHVLDTHPAHLVYNYKMNKARLGLYQKMLSDKSSVSILFLPMFVCIDGLRVVVSKPANQLKEIGADTHIPLEYRPAFVEYIENHIMTNPTTASGVIVTNEEFDNEQQKGVMFTAECIRLMKQRRNVVKTQLEIHYKLFDNNYFKDVCKKVIDRVGIHDKPVKSLRESLFDSAFDRDDAAAITEANHLLSVMESKVTNRDIMILAADASNIRTVEDKTYCINNIFDSLEALDKQRKKAIKKVDGETNESKKAAATKDIDEKITRLNSILTDVMNTKVDYYKNNHYGVFIQYPDGYEG